MNREQVENLKKNWKEDPQWDIEDTEGFEEYHDELLDFRLYCEKEWSEKRIAETNAKAKRLNCSFELAEYIIFLEDKIEKLEYLIDNLKN